MIKFFHNGEKLVCDRNSRRNYNSQGNCAATNNSMSQHTAQQARGIRKEKLVATKEFPIAIEIAKESKRSYRDKEKNVATNSRRTRT